MNKQIIRWLLFSFFSVCTLIWILWTIIFPLFIDERLFIMGNLSGIPILNPYYGLTIPIAIFLIYYLIREFIRIKKSDTEIENES